MINVKKQTFNWQPKHTVIVNNVIIQVNSTPVEEGRELLSYIVSRKAPEGRTVPFLRPNDIQDLGRAVNELKDFLSNEYNEQKEGTGEGKDSEERDST